MYTGAQIALGYFEESNSGLDLCNGRCLIATRVFFQSIPWVSLFGTDIYMFLHLSLQAKKFSYISSLHISYNLPKNMSDYVAQSSRAFLIKKQFQEILGDNILQFFPHRKKILLLKSTLRQFAKKPLNTLLYILLKFFSKFFYEQRAQKSTWTIATSTK
jgi:hypothetical protein